MDYKYRILIISTYPPSRSGGVVQDLIVALENEGHYVDFFTMHSFKGQKPNQYSIYREPITNKLIRIKQKFPFLNIFKSIARFIAKKTNDDKNSVVNNGFRIPQFDETLPPVDDVTLFESLPDKKYDFIMTYVTERMITTPSFITIYNKYNAPLLIACMDMLHFTGGCYFFGDCRRFSEGCGRCRILNSDDENDQTHINFLIKASVYPQIQYGIICNRYQKQFALQCKLFDPKHIFTKCPLIDEEVFIPNSIKECRDLFGISSSKRHIILSRYESGLSRAKGYDHLVRIINTVYERLTECEKKESLLMLIGSKENEISRQIKMDTLFPGFLDLSHLIKSYSAATVFISTSIDDAGPTMVNQSMMCGTPVITFSIGTALDVTRSGINGYMVTNYDDSEFADMILKIIRKPYDKYIEMRARTRESALEMNSKKANADRVIEIFEQVRDLYSNEVKCKG